MQEQTDRKTALRAEAIAKRDAIPYPVRKIKDAAVKARLLSLEEYSSANTVLLYASFRSEVSTDALISDALSTGKTVLLPKVNTDDLSLELYKITGIDDLAPGYMGISEPAGFEGSRAGLAGANLVVLPGAAFDESGRRLGYGKGCYDRLLSDTEMSATLVALAYEEQILEEVPADSHDILVQTIITDRRTIHCHG